MDRHRERARYRVRLLIYFVLFSFEDRHTTKRKPSNKPELTFTVDISKTKFRNAMFSQHYEFCTTNKHAFHSKRFQKKLAMAFCRRSLKFRLDTWSISGVYDVPAGVVATGHLHRTNYNFLRRSTFALRRSRELCSCLQARWEISAAQRSRG